MEKLAKGFLWLAALSVMVVSGCAEDQSSGEPGANYRATQPAIDYSTTMALVAQARQDPDTHAIAALTELDWQRGAFAKDISTGSLILAFGAEPGTIAIIQLGADGQVGLAALIKPVPSKPFPFSAELTLSADGEEYYLPFVGNPQSGQVSVGLWSNGIAPNHHPVPYPPDSPTCSIRSDDPCASASQEYNLALIDVGFGGLRASQAVVDASEWAHGPSRCSWTGDLAADVDCGSSLERFLSYGENLLPLLRQSLAGLRRITTIELSNQQCFSQSSNVNQSAEY